MPVDATLNSSKSDSRASQQFWSGRGALVTGATGMLGSCLVKELLARNARVVVLIQDADPLSELYRSGDDRRVAIVNGNLESFADLERAVNCHETNVVFHLAAQTLVGAGHRYPLATFETNIRGTYNLLEVCRIHSGIIRSVVVASSDKAYGDRSDLPYTEDMPLAGRHPYEVSKSCADLLAQSYAQTYGLPIAITRCGNIYGGGDLNWSRIVPDTIRRLLRGQRPSLRSDGTFLRDYIYVIDVARAYLRLAETVEDPAVRGHAFNFSPERPMSVLEMVAAIQRAVGGPLMEPEILNTATGEIRHQYLSAAKARRVLGWQCEFDLDRGLRDTVEWYRNFFSPRDFEQVIR